MNPACSAVSPIWSGEDRMVEARTGGTQGICISEDAFRLVRGKVATEFADIGEQSLKNIARSLPDLPRAPSWPPRPPADCRAAFFKA